MENHDHAYTSTYIMNSKEVEEFVKLRASNDYLFTGRRDNSRCGWRAILRHMGLQEKLTHRQASKKWENMKKRYKELKNPPDGVTVFPETWQHFTLMDDAVRGQLRGSAPILMVLPSDKAADDFLSKKRKVCSPTVSIEDCPEIQVSLSGNEDGDEEMVEGAQDIERIMQEVEDTRNVIESERQEVEIEKRLMERERQVLQRERAVLDREFAALERDRAMLERERVALERERVVMDKEKAMVEKDKDAVEKEKARLVKLFTPKVKTGEVTEDGSKVKDTHVMDSKEQLFYLIEKLIELF